MSESKRFSLWQNALKHWIILDGDDPLKVIKSLMEHGFSREYTGDNGGNMYGPGVYNVYSLRSSNDRARGYGQA